MHTPTHQFCFPLKRFIFRCLLTQRPQRKPAIMPFRFRSKIATTPRSVSIGPVVDTSNKTSCRHVNHHAALLRRTQPAVLPCSIAHNIEMQSCLCMSIVPGTFVFDCIGPVVTSHARTHFIIHCFPAMHKQTRNPFFSSRVLT